MNEADERAKRKAGASGVTTAAAAAGMAAGVMAEALLGGQQSPHEAAPATRDPFDALVPPAEPEAPVASAPPASPIDEPTATRVAETVPTATATADAVTEPVDVAPAAPVANEPAPEPVAAEPPSVSEPTPVTEPTPTFVAEQPVAVDPPMADPTDAEPPAVDEPVITEPVVLDPTVLTNDPAAHLGNGPFLQPIINPGPDGNDLLPTDQPTVNIAVSQPMATPTDPHTATPPQSGMEPGAGLDPITGLAPSANMPPVIGGPIDDPLATPMPPDPGIEPPAPFDAPTDGFDGGGVPGPGRPVMPAEPVAVDPIAPVPEMPVTPEPIIVDVKVQNAAMDAVAQFGKYVEGFGDVPFKELGVMDKGEFWRAIKELDPTLTGYVTELSFAVQEGYTLAQIADHFGVNIAELAQMVDLDPDGAQTFAELRNTAPHTSSLGEINVISFEYEGQTYFVGSDGQAWPEGEPEAAFSVLSSAETNWTDHPDGGNYGWLFFVDLSEGAEIFPTLD